MTLEELNKLIGKKDFNTFFEYIYKKCYKNCIINLRKMRASKDDAEDVFQDAIIVLWQKLKKVDFTIETSVCAFLNRTCRYIWLNKLREMKKLPTDELDPNFKIYGDKNIEELIEDKESSEILLDAIGQLGELCQRTLYDYYYLGKSTVTMAEAEGVSGGVIRARLCNCRNRLRVLLNNNKNK